MSRKALNISLVWLCFLFVLVITFCYTIPVILVYFGLGKIIASFVLYFPWLIPLTQSQFSLFSLSGILLLTTDKFLQNTIKNLSIATYEHLNTLNHLLFNFSLLFWAIGFILAYLLTPVLLFMDVI